MDVLHNPGEGGAFSSFQAGLLASGMASDPPFPPALPKRDDRRWLRGGLPVTVAGPPGIFTRFPILPLGHLEHVRFDSSVVFYASFDRLSKRIRTASSFPMSAVICGSKEMEVFKMPSFPATHAPCSMCFPWSLRSVLRLWTMMSLKSRVWGWWPNGLRRPADAQWDRWNGRLRHALARGTHGQFFPSMPKERTVPWKGLSVHPEN